MGKGDKQKYTQESILHVDATPDDEYPLRILRAYRENCNVRWEVSGDIDSLPYDVMNEACEQRAKILDKAIIKLGRERSCPSCGGDVTTIRTCGFNDAYRCSTCSLVSGFENNKVGDENPPPPPPPHPLNVSTHPGHYGKPLCPRCQRRVHRRKGVHFDHEHRCPNCDWIGEIE
ncbi:hypothetical protein LCGC14_0220040 [marine sediment metagenome]|uniref:Uncharacterized protein n=1 Tax=marine sediment metagenome TaxID=412755 RepID=A0A0F9UHJ9_9ZZZZ